MATIDPGNVRHFERCDVDELLALMHTLAVFEGYDDRFCVTRKSLIEHGLGKTPKFRAHVVPNRCDDSLLGMAVTYVVPWTYTLKPNLVLKELFVIDSARGCGVGTQLMQAVVREGRACGVGQIVWTVLSDNAHAKRFYRNQGARHDQLWENWTLAAP